MAIFHCQSKPISRSTGRSATAAAAYRAADRIVDERTGEIHDYTKKAGVVHREIVTPGGVPDWASDREKLWNAAEAAERRKDARVCREWELALPDELTADQRRDLARQFARELSTGYQIVVDVAIHLPHKEGDSRNHHAHLLTTTRTIERDGFGAKSDLELSDKDLRAQGKAITRDQVTLIRERWAALVNQALERHGHEARVDHRSLEAQGIEAEPTKHLGPTATAMERRGLRTDRGDLNRAALDLREVQSEAHQAAQLHQGAGQEAKAAAKAWRAEKEAEKRAQQERERQQEERRQEQERQEKERAERVAAEAEKRRQEELQQKLEERYKEYKAKREREQDRDGGIEL